MRDAKFNQLRTLKIQKWSLAWLMIIAMIVQSLALAPSIASGASSDFAGGDGTTENPYLIASAEQLDKIRNELDKHYRLTADIDLAGYSNWLPIPEFAGSLDGDGHTIRNLMIDRDTMNDVGLFSIARMDNDQGDGISNLNMSNAKVIGLAGVGSLVGRVYSGTISNVHVDLVEIEGYSEAVGGLIGRIDSNTTITDSSATNVTVVGAKSHVGGLTGRNAAAAGTSATVSNSFASGTVTGTGNHVGGLMGSLNNGTVTGSYATVQVEGNNNNTGGLIGIIDAGQVLDSYATGNVIGEAFTGGLIGTLVNGAIINSSATGNTEGTEHTTGGLVGQMTHANSLIEHSRAEGDVVGNHSHVGGLVGALYLGNINYGIAEGNVRNIGTGENTGGLIGWMKGGTTVSHSTASGEVTKTGSRGGNIGGLIGWLDNGTITSSSASGKVTNDITAKGAWNAGGLIGRLSNGTVEDSVADGEVVGNLGENTGGLIGFVESGQVLNSSATGNVSSTFSNTGGLIGIIETGQVRNSSAIGDVSNGDSNVGGLIGFVKKQAIVSDSFARGNVSTFGFVDVNSSNVGGLIGGVGRNVASGELIDDVQLIRVHAYGNVSAKQGNVGGLIGFLHGNMNALIEDSSASGNVTAEGTRSDEKAGGLVGELLGGNIQSSRASGDIQGVMAGGIIGRLNPQYPIHISDVYYSGSVQGRESIGGIIGILESFSGEVTLSNAFASGQVTIGKKIGGIAGSIETMQNVVIQDVYALQSKIGDQATSTDTIYRVIGDIAHWSVSGKKVILKNLRADPSMAIEERRKLGLDNWGGQDVDAEVNQAILWKDTERIRAAYHAVLPIPIEEPIRQALLDRLTNFSFLEVKMPDVTIEPLLISNQFVLPFQYRTVGSLNGALRITLGSQNMVLPITDPLPDTSGVWQDFTVSWDSDVFPLADGSYTSVQIKFDTAERSWDYEWNQAVIKDTVPPNITVDAKLADDTAYVAETIANQPVIITSSVVDEQTDVVLHQYQVNEGEWQDYVGPIEFNLDGDYSIIFKVADGAGNERLSSETIISLKLNNAELPTITTQPSDIMVIVGGDATLNVQASVSDGGELSYQWYSNTSNSNSGGTAIADATSSTYEVPTTSVGTVYYYVEVTNENTDATGSQTAMITSEVAEVTVNALTHAERPTLATTHPLNITVNIGDHRTLGVLANISDGGTLSYQWYSNTSNSISGGTAIDGATATTYEVPTTAVGTTYYYVEVTNTNADVTGNQTATTTSQVATVTVNELTNAELPTITIQPSDITVFEGVGVTTLSVTANVNDEGELSYQWYSNTSNSTSGGAAIADATSSTYEVPTSLAGTVYYYVEVTNTNTEATGNQTATTTSQVAAVTVIELTFAELPEITTHPLDITVNEGSRATLSVVASVSDGGELSYQWYSNTSNSTRGGNWISGATSATYEAPTSVAGTIYYYVAVTNTKTDPTGIQTAVITSEVAAVTVIELTHAELPTITTQPSDITVNIGDNAALNVAANVSDGGELSYQWYSNTSNSTSGGTAIADATSVTYEAPTTTSGMVYYYVVVTNTNISTEVIGSQTAMIASRVASVTVNELTNAELPTIITQPSDITVNVGGDAPLSVAANVEDEGTLSYQWYSNTSNSTSGGIAISGAVSTTYEVPTNEVGTTYYYVEVTNTKAGATGSKTATTISQVATVTVNELTNAGMPTITLHPSSLTVSVGDEATLSVAAEVNDGGTLSYQWYSNTLNTTSGGTAMSGATNATYKVPTNDADTTYYYVEVTNTNAGATGSQTATATSQVAIVTVNELTEPTNAETPTIMQHPSSIMISVGSEATISVAAGVNDGGKLSYQWYSNTSNMISGGTAISGTTSASYKVPTNEAGITYYYVEVTNTNAGATGSQTATITSQVAIVTVNELTEPTNAEAPTITHHPSSITVNIGAEEALSVVASVNDGGNLSYQWYSNTSNTTSGGTAISGATSATYEVPTSLAGTTYYYVEITNTNTNATGKQTATTMSQVAAVTVNELTEPTNAETPTITQHPSSIIVSEGDDATLRIAAGVSDEGVLSYQWYSNMSNTTSGGTAISGATSATYKVPTNEAGTTYYYVEVTNTNTGVTGDQTAMITSQVAVVTVNELTEPTNAEPPNITEHPSSIIVSEGDEATLNVAAAVNDGGTLNYQWYSNSSNTTSGGTAISGATSATYKVPTNEAGTTYYYVEVTNTNISATGNQTATTMSQVAAITVNELTEPTNAELPTITQHPSSIIVSEGDGATLNVAAGVSDEGVLSYQWYRNTSNTTSGGTAIIGATSASYAVPTNLSGTTYYYVEVTNTNTSATGNQTATTMSQVAAVTVNKLTEPTNAAMPIATPEGGTISSGTKVALSTTTVDATIYFTTDGSTPTNNSTKYTVPIEITTAMTIKAIAVKNGMNDSEIMIEHYTIATVPTPKNLTATAGERLVTLNWNAVIGNDAVSYTVYRYEGTTSPVNSSDWVLVQENIVDTTYSVNALINGKNYTFAVRAIVAGNASEFSNAATATPKASGINGGSGGWANTEPGHVTSTNGTITIPVGSTGEVSLDQEIMIKVPKGAAEQELRIMIDKLLDTASLLTDQGVHVSPIFEVTKNFSDNFKKPVSLSIKFNPTEVGDNQKVSIFYYDENNKMWTEVGGKIEGEWITTEVDHFTKFAVMAVDLKNDDDNETPKQPSPSFHDIAGHWGERSIIRAAEQKLVSGYSDGTFRPNNPITRAEFTVMLVNALQLDGTGSELTFTDQDRIGVWAKREVALAVQMGIINGYEDGSFLPEEQITRAEMAIMIARALGLSLETDETTGFVDDDNIPQWAKGSVEAIRKLGIISGRSGNKFVPNDMSTRAEAIVVLLRVLEVREQL